MTAVNSRLILKLVTEEMTTQKKTTTTRLQQSQDYEATLPKLTQSILSG